MLINRKKYRPNIFHRYNRSNIIQCNFQVEIKFIIVCVLMSIVISFQSVPDENGEESDS